MTCYVIVDRWGNHLSSRKVFALRIDAEAEIANLCSYNDYDHFDIEEMVYFSGEKTNESGGTCAVSAIH